MTGTVLGITTADSREHRVAQSGFRIGQSTNTITDPALGAPESEPNTPNTNAMGTREASWPPLPSPPQAFSISRHASHMPLHHRKPRAGIRKRTLAFLAEPLNLGDIRKQLTRNAMRIICFYSPRFTPAPHVLAIQFNTEAVKEPRRNHQSTWLPRKNDKSLISDLSLTCSTRPSDDVIAELSSSSSSQPTADGNGAVTEHAADLGIPRDAKTGRGSQASQPERSTADYATMRELRNLVQGRRPA